MYAKLEANKLIYAPKNYKTPTHLILNFDKNIELMEQYGFKKIAGIKPEYDNATQYLSVDGYMEDENAIVINYVIREIESAPQEPTLEDRISKLEKVVEEQNEFIEKYKLLSLLK